LSWTLTVPDDQTKVIMSNWVRILGVIGIVSLSYVVFSIVSQAPEDRHPVIVFALFVVVVSICVVAYTMITGRPKAPRKK
jgi:NhaP-type Na+/H+ or K+/H+ antiporter